MRSYRAAQQARNQRITDYARAELVRLNAAGVPDRLSPLFRSWADLRMIDGAIDPSPRAHPVCYAGDPERANAGVFGIGTLNTCTWLNMWSLPDRTAGALPHLADSTCRPCSSSRRRRRHFPSQADEIFAAVASADKEYVTLPGDHYFVEPAPTAYQVADVVADWVNAR